MSEQAPFDRDPQARALAERLSSLDLASQSRVRASLRARLLRRTRSKPPFFARLPTGLTAALAGAAIVLLLMRPRAPEPRLPAPHHPAPTSGSESPRPAKHSLMPGGAKTPAPRLRQTQPPAAGLEHGPFVSIAARSPFESHGTVSAGSLFVTAAGRRTNTPRGRAVVWEFPHATFQLEEQPVRIEDLFVKPTL